jgi:hypothetical protein
VMLGHLGMVFFALLKQIRASRVSSWPAIPLAARKMRGRRERQGESPMLAEALPSHLCRGVSIEAPPLVAFMITEHDVERLFRLKRRDGILVLTAG